MHPVLDQTSAKVASEPRSNRGEDMKRRSWILSLGGTVALVGSSMMAAGAASAGEVTEDFAARFRASFGLPKSEAVVRESLTDPSKYGNTDWGVPLTAAEADEILERSLIVDRTKKAVEKAVERDGFAGVYYDQKRGGIPVFLFSAGRAASEAVVVKAAGSQEVEVRKVERSWSELLDIKAAVSDREGALGKRGIQLTSVGPDTRNNRVIVGVDSKVEAAREVLAEFGDSVMVAKEAPSSADACTGVKNCPPAKAGLELNGNNGYRCTAGFIGKRTNGGGNHKVIMTAGHCLALNASFDHHNDDAGVREAWIWNSSMSNYPTIPSDVGIIDIDSGFVPTSANKILTHNNDTQEYVTDYMPWLSGHFEGTPVCRIGAGSAYKPGYPARVCGEIIKLQNDSLSCTGGAGESPPCAKVTNTVKVDFDSTGGDSGAPYWRVGEGGVIEAMGLHVHSGVDGDDPFAANAGKGRYTPISRAMNKLDSDQGVEMQLCLNVSCN